MEAFKNFKIAAYVYAYYLKDADDAEIQRGIDYFKKYIHLDKVYIENHRGVVDIPPQRLREVKALFEKNGIETSGGITSTQLVDGAAQALLLRHVLLHRSPPPRGVQAHRARACGRV